MRPTKRPTLADVAALAAVDKAVVSRVLSNDPALRVRDETRQRVLDVVEQVGYRRNVNARSLRTSRATAIGLVIPTYDNPVYTAIVNGAAAGAVAHDSFLLTASLTTLEIAGESATDLIATGRVDGLLLAGQSLDTSLNASVVNMAPVLSVNRRVSGFDRWVVLDDEGAARVAVQHLVKLGHERIAHIAGTPTADTAIRRRTGFLDAMSDSGLTVGDGMLVEADYTLEGGALAASKLAALDERPTAIVVANVSSAVGALFALRSGGVSVPYDTSIIAIHDLPLARFIEPALTVVSMPLHELGRRGVELLMTKPGDEIVNEVVRGPMELVERSSTSPPKDKL